MPPMFRKRKDANNETMAMGRVVGVARNASPAHRVAALQEREGAGRGFARARAANPPPGDAELRAALAGD